MARPKCALGFLRRLRACMPWISTTVLAVTFAGCQFHSRADELAALQRAAPQLLRAAPVSGPVPPEQWPPVLAALRPESVYARPEGIYIVTSTLFVEEKGLFLPRTSWAKPKRASGTDPEYAIIAEGLYAYSIQG